MNFRRFLRRLAAIAGLGLGLIVSGQAPTIISTPSTVTSYVGYPAKLDLVVDSPVGTPTYQWYLAGFGALPGTFTNVFGATNATLVFKSLTLSNNGAYLAIVTNSGGAVTSAPVNLVVLTPPQPALNFGELIDSLDGSVSLPISYASQGSETNVSFSVAFDGAVLTDPTFEVAAPVTLPEPPDGTIFGQASDIVPATTLHTDANGQIDSMGIAFDLDGGRVFPAGERLLGRLRWHLSPGRNAYEGRLAPASVPTPAQARSLTNGVLIDLILGQAPPMLLNRERVPVLDRQSGLYLQPLVLANPGSTDLTNARVIVVSLPVDSRTNQVVVYNALSRVGFNAIVELGTVPAGSSRQFTLEYFVPDHNGWPVDAQGPILPVLTTSAGILSGRVFPPGVTLADARVRVTRQSSIPNAAFVGVLLDFPTQINRSYYIQYSAQPDFTLTNQVRLVLPFLPGTGTTVQWIDNGPPKTESSPTDSDSRFYRVLEVR